MIRFLYDLPPDADPLGPLDLDTGVLEFFLGWFGTKKRKPIKPVTGDRIRVYRVELDVVDANGFRLALDELPYRPGGRDKETGLWVVECRAQPMPGDNSGLHWIASMKELKDLRRTDRGTPDPRPE